MLKVIVKGQIIFLPTSSIIAGDTINMVSARFVFTSEWSNLEKVAYFEKDHAVFPFMLKDDCIYAEDGFNLSAGRWNVTVRGYDKPEDISLVDVNNDIYARLTTGIASFLVVQNGPDGDGVVEPSIKGWVEKTYLDASTAKDTARLLQDKLEKGELNGKDAYDIAIESGFEGSREEWLASLKGESTTVEIVEDNDDAFILQFTSSNGIITTPNLKSAVNLEEFRKVGDSKYWEQNADYVPSAGEIIIYTDGLVSYTPNGIKVTQPTLKIGDGATPLERLSFLQTNQLPHKLIIGDIEFDGSKDVIIPVYRGQLT